MAIAASYCVGSHLCGFDTKHVSFDLVVVTSGIITHFSIHETLKRIRVVLNRFRNSRHNG